MGIPGEPCFTCDHVLGWHDAVSGCQAEGCVCADFVFRPGCYRCSSRFNMSMTYRRCMAEVGRECWCDCHTEREDTDEL